MKTQGKVWIIYNSKTKVQSKPLSVIQAQVFIFSLSNEDFKNHFLWTPGWEQWVNISTFLNSNQRYFTSHQPPIPDDSFTTFKREAHDANEEHTEGYTASRGTTESPYTQVLQGEAPLKVSTEPVSDFYVKDFNGNELDLSKIRKIKPQKKILRSDSERVDRRRDSRVGFKIEIVLVSKLRSFRTYSKNISLSGTLLDNEIPKDFLDKPFDLIIVNPFETDPTKSRLLFRAKIVGDLKDPRRLMFIEQDKNMTERLDALLKAYIAYQERIGKNAG